MNQALYDLLVDFALLGVMFVGMMTVLYGVLIGYLLTRPSKMERQILHRALLAQPLSQDPIVAKKERRLLKALEVVE